MENSGSRRAAERRADIGVIVNGFRHRRRTGGIMKHRQTTLHLWLCCSFCLSGVLGVGFTCHRPSTPCDTWQGLCQPDGACACNNGASGLQCQIPGQAKRNDGNCLVFNPCVAGTCYDDGVVTKCDCSEGLYGEKCEHPMVYVECDANRMVMNIFPYGYDRHAWSALPPLAGENFTCQLSDVPSFLSKHPTYNSRRWDGFAAAFAHESDPCAGNATVVSETATSISYSRTLYVSYSPTGGPDPTDQTLEVTCDVAKVKPTPPPVALPKARIGISFRTPQGHRVRGVMKPGATVYVMFQLNVPNREQYDDVQVDMCSLKDLVTKRNVVVVDRACAVFPMGETLYKKALGLSVLVMKVFRIPGMSRRVTFQCRMRACNTAIDDYCSTPANCHQRGRRSASHVIGGAASGDVFMVESSITI